jgi:hypothetical protein
VGCVQRGDADGKAKGFPSVIEGNQGVDGIVAVAVGNGDHQWKLTAMLEGVGGEFVEAVAIDPALAVVIPAPKGQRITVRTQTRAAVFEFFALIFTGAELFTVGIGPGGEFAAIASDVEVGKVNQAQLEGTSDKAGKEDRVKNAFIGMESRKVSIAFENGDQGWWCGSASQNAIHQAIDDT